MSQNTLTALSSSAKPASAPSPPLVAPNATNPTNDPYIQMLESLDLPHDEALETLERMMLQYKQQCKSNVPTQGATVAPNAPQQQQTSMQSATPALQINAITPQNTALRPLKRGNGPIAIGAANNNAPKVLPLKRKAEGQGMRRIPLGKKGK